MSRRNYSTSLCSAFKAQVWTVSGESRKLFLEAQLKFSCFHFVPASWIPRCSADKKHCSFPLLCLLGFIICQGGDFKGLWLFPYLHSCLIGAGGAGGHRFFCLPDTQSSLISWGKCSLLKFNDTAKPQFVCCHAAGLFSFLSTGGYWLVILIFTEVFFCCNMTFNCPPLNVWGAGRRRQVELSSRNQYAVGWMSFYMQVRLMKYNDIKLRWKKRSERTVLFIIM